VHVLILGGAPDSRRRAARACLPTSHNAFTADSATLPFTRPKEATLPPAPRVFLLDDIERAFPDAQANGVRLVLTQSTYLLQAWLDRLDEGDRIVATADRAALERCAPEALRRRGPWRAFELRDLDNPRRVPDTKNTKDAEEDLSQDTSSRQNRT